MSETQTAEAAPHHEAVTLEALQAALKKETKKAVQLRDEGNLEEAAVHMKNITKLKKAIAKGT